MLRNARKRADQDLKGIMPDARDGAEAKMGSEAIFAYKFPLRLLIKLAGLSFLPEQRLSLKCARRPALHLCPVRKFQRKAGLRKPKISSKIRCRKNAKIFGRVAKRTPLYQENAFRLDETLKMARGPL